jgi:uncharacterized protein YecE (DUF72 family)
MTVAIGTSGFAYDHWRGVLYPEELRRDQWLTYYASTFPTVELNVTFYRTPPKATCEAWRRATPAHFKFVVKGSRFITHLTRLEDAADPLKTFFQAVGHLGAKLGVVLWQLPPGQPADPTRLDRFLNVIGRTLSPRLRWAGRLRHALEFRERSWYSDAVYKVLRRHDAAMVIADSPFNLVTEGMEQPTGPAETDTIVVPLMTSWTYLRRHGPNGQIRRSYSEAYLRQLGTAVTSWAKRGDVFVFFNNDPGGCAVKDALALRRLVEPEIRAREATRRRRA